MSYERKEYIGNAAATTLTNPLATAATTIVIDDATNWPTGGANGAFIVSVGRGLATEETILCESRTGTTITVRASTGRGHDGTTDQDHAAGVVIEHVVDAESIDQVNRLANLMTTKGDSILSNGTNPVRVGTGAVDDTTDGHVLQLSWGAATGWVVGRLVTLLSQASAPAAVAGYIRFWYDETFNLIRPSDGSSWLVPVQIISVADATDRDSLFSTPLKGHTCWREDLGFHEHYNGTAWAPLGNEATFASTTARDAYFTTPVDGDQAYITDDHDHYLYRNGEWIRTSAKTTIAATQPASPQIGDLWLQPVV